MESVKIPQNVQVEDRIVGPFTIKQLVLLGIGGGFSYALFATIKNAVGHVPITAHLVIWWPAIFAAAFSLIRINDISLFQYCMLILEMFSRPRKRVWQPRQGLIINIQTHSPIAAKIGVPGLVPHFRVSRKKKEEEKGAHRTSNDLEALTSILELDRRGQALRSDEDVETVVSVNPLERSVDTLHEPPL
jgi:hypothetical protein